MSLTYHIYANNGAGGPVDTGTIVATVSGLTWDSPPLGAGSDNTWLVRAYDTVSTLEDQNTDARVRVLIGNDGSDLTGLPNSPVGLTAVAGAGGSVRVMWHYNAGGQGGAPGGFHVYTGTPTPSFASPAATVAYNRDNTSRAYSLVLTGFTDALVYQVAVRAWNATGEEQNAVVATFTADATGPTAVDALVATVVP